MPSKHRTLEMERYRNFILFLRDFFLGLITQIDNVGREQRTFFKITKQIITKKKGFHTSEEKNCLTLNIGSDYQ